MRSTITLDDDVAGRIREEMVRSGGSFRQVVNDLLRRGLDPPPVPRGAYRTPSVSLGRYYPGQLDDVAEALAVAEGEDYR